MLSKPWISLGALVMGLALSFAVVAAEGDKPQGDEAKKEAKQESKAQTTCPVMGGKIDKAIFADYDGKRIYFCCKGCPAEFAKDPAKYVKKLEDDGVTLEKAPSEDVSKEGAGGASGGGCCR